MTSTHTALLATHLRPVLYRTLIMASLRRVHGYRACPWLQYVHLQQQQVQQSRDRQLYLDVPAPELDPVAATKFSQAILASCIILLCIIHGAHSHVFIWYTAQQ